MVLLSPNSADVERAKWEMMGSAEHKSDRYFSEGECCKSILMLASVSASELDRERGGESILP